MKRILLLIFLPFFFLTPSVLADCRGCCSHHGGVVCSGGVTRCADGTPLSAKCRGKGCNKCYGSVSPSSKGSYSQPSSRSKNIIAQDQHLTAYGNGTVLDKKNNLMWATKDNGQTIEWEDANRYCKNFTLGGFSDWRMPTIDELKTLYDKNQKGYFPNPGSSTRVYLSRLIHLTSWGVWSSQETIFDFHVGNWFNKRPFSKRVLPVRNNK